jgi:hypothetical protein
MEVTRSFQIMVDFQQTTQHYILEDRTLYNHCCENLKFCTGKLVPHYTMSYHRTLYSLFTSAWKPVPHTLCYNSLHLQENISHLSNNFSLQMLFREITNSFVWKGLHLHSWSRNYLLSWSTKIQYHKNLPWDHILRYLKLIHSILPCFSEINFIVTSIYA